MAKTVKKPQIVIADDNDNIRQTLKDILLEKGYCVETVKDGYELLSFLKQNPSDIIILDLMMPEKGGIEVFDSLKYVCPGVKIVIYTAFHKYEGSSFIHFADKFILKDAPPQKLLEAIEELL